MTQPISSRTRWPGAHLTCANASEDDEPFTCDETPPAWCAAERTHRVSAPNARADIKAPWGLAFCRDANTVVEGFLCDEPTVVSDACRTPNNDFDAFVCDEPRMERLQRTILRETWSLLKALALGARRGKP